MTDGHGPSGWLVVVPPGLPDPELARFLALAAERGWEAASSHGQDQDVLAVRGPRDAGELVPLVHGLGADVLPLLAPERYRRERVRRRRLSILVGVLGLSIVAGVVLPLITFLRPPPRPILEPALLRVAAADAIAPGQALRARFHDQPVLVIRVAPHGWRAVGATCTFAADCLLEWDAARGVIVCPCHGCRFDAEGNVLAPPASTPLLRLDVLEREDGLHLRRLL